jgi:hypothetical protein
MGTLVREMSRNGCQASRRPRSPVRTVVPGGRFGSRVFAGDPVVPGHDVVMALRSLVAHCGRRGRSKQDPLAFYCLLFSAVFLSLTTGPRRAKSDKRLVWLLFHPAQVGLEPGRSPRERTALAGSLHTQSAPQRRISNDQFHAIVPRRRLRVTSGCGWEQIATARLALARVIRQAFARVICPALARGIRPSQFPPCAPVFSVLCVSMFLDTLTSVGSR